MNQTLVRLFRRVVLIAVVAMTAGCASAQGAADHVRRSWEATVHSRLHPRPQDVRVTHPSASWSWGGNFSNGPTWSESGWGWNPATGRIEHKTREYGGPVGGRRR